MFPKDVVIPDKIGGRVVKKIGDLSFSSKGLTGVKLPDKVTSIGKSAFYNNNIRNLIIPDSVLTIDENGFAEAGIKNITLSKNLQIISKRAFYHNRWDENTIIEIPSGIFIDFEAFRGFKLTKINTLILNKEIIDIVGSENFMDFYVKTLILSPINNSYDMHYFYGRIGTLIIKNDNGINVNFKGDCIYYIKKLVFEEGIKTINNSDFEGKQIEEIVIPQSMQDMPEKIFKSNSSVTKVRLPEKFRNHPNNNNSPTGWWDYHIDPNVFIEYY